MTQAVPSFIIHGNVYCFKQLSFLKEETNLSNVSLEQSSKLALLNSETWPFSKSYKDVLATYLELEEIK